MRKHKKNKKENESPSEDKERQKEISVRLVDSTPNREHSPSRKLLGEGSDLPVNAFRLKLESHSLKKEFDTIM